MMKRLTPSLIILLLAFLEVHTLASPAQPQGSLNSTKATVRLPNLETPPNPYIYRYDQTHKVVFDRKGTGHSHLNPSTSIYNFEHALEAAGRIILDTQHHFHVEGNTPFPNNRFIYEDALARPSFLPSLQPRRIRLEIRGVHNFLFLTYDAVKVVMLGLRDYKSLWDARSRGESRVNMCNFTLFWEEYGGQRIAEGSVNLIVSPAAAKAAASF